MHINDDAQSAKILRNNLDEVQLAKLTAIRNARLHRFIADAIQICEPASVFVCTDAAEDMKYIREGAVRTGEEVPLAMEGHTRHFDGMNDQARAKEVTRYLLKPGVSLGKNLNATDHDSGVAEVQGFLKGSMAGKEMLVRFFSLGPAFSDFTVLGVQLTDSFYVAHSEDLLYRAGYGQFKTIDESAFYIRVLHSAGRLEGGVSADEDKKRIYIDIEEDLVYSVNTQYAGNTVGFKKLAHRLAIRKADREAWLAEHMLVMGVHGPGGRVTYFTGAFPSACGKTSTAMLPGETIIGDDLAYLRKCGDAVHAVNVESGIFGIIRDVNPDDDPVIWNELTKPGEAIFSNILVKDDVPCWEGSGVDMPAEGLNYSGEWFEGKTDANGKVIDPSHKNSRYTIRLAGLDNLDEKANDPEGVPVGGIIYGGRDSDTCVPVLQAFDWEHGVITTGASIESETTAATLGKTGVRAFQPMSNLDFVAVPLGRYIRNHLDFTSGIEKTPEIFGVNYFLKNADGGYLNGMNDKRVWVKWMELRVNGDVDVIETPTGLIPLYEDLERLFKEVLGADYTREDYVEQFTLRIPENLAKIDRISKIWSEIEDTPAKLFEALGAQKLRLEKERLRRGDYVSPFDLVGE